MPVDEGYRPMPGEPGPPPLPPQQPRDAVRDLAQTLLRHVDQLDNLAWKFQAIHDRLDRHSDRIDALSARLETLNRRSTKIMGSVEDLTAITAVLRADEDQLAAFVSGQAALNAQQQEQIQILTDALANVQVPPEVGEAVTTLAQISTDMEALLPVAPEPPAE